MSLARPSGKLIAHPTAINFARTGDKGMWVREIKPAREVKKFQELTLVGDRHVRSVTIL